MCRKRKNFIAASKIKFHEESSLLCRDPQWSREPRQHTREARLESMSAQKAHTSEQAVPICSEDRERRGLYLVRSLSTFTNLRRCNLKKRRDAFSVCLFPSARNIIARMSGGFVQGNIAAPRCGHDEEVPEKYQKKLKEMAKLESPTSFPAASFHSFVFVHLVAISTNSGAVKSFVWMTRESCGGRGTLSAKS